MGILVSQDVQILTASSTIKNVINYLNALVFTVKVYFIQHKFYYLHAALSPNVVIKNSYSASFQKIEMPCA